MATSANDPAIASPRQGALAQLASISDAFTRSAWRYWTLCALVLAIVSIPLMLAIHPPFIDYPFHVGRIALLAAWSETPFYKEYYQLSSLIVPNLALEMVMLPLSKLLSTTAAAKIFIVLSFALILSGTASLHRALYGEWSLWSLAAAAFIYNWITLFGFMNYIFGVGVLLWSLAAWCFLANRTWWLRLVAGSVFALLLFFSHLVVFGLYAVAVAGMELQRLIDTKRMSGRIELQSAMTGAAQFLLPLALYVLASPTTSITSGGIVYRWFEKMASPVVTLSAGNPYVDSATALLILVSAILVILYGKITLASRFFGPAIFLLLAFLALPYAVQLGVTTFMDVRVPTALLFIAIAATKVSFRNLQAGAVMVALCCVYLLFKTVMLSNDALVHDRVVRAHVEAFEHITPGSVLFIARQEVPHSWAQRMYRDRIHAPPHVVSLATLQREVFVPAMYAIPGAQPINVKPAYLPVKQFQGDVPIELAEDQSLAHLAEELLALQRHPLTGQEVYLLLQDRGMQALTLPSTLILVTDGPGFRLLRIANPG